MSHALANFPALSFASIKYRGAQAPAVPKGAAGFFAFRGTRSKARSLGRR
jgi:hypothetical protein